MQNIGAHVCNYNQSPRNKYSESFFLDGKKKREDAKNTKISLTQLRVFVNDLAFSQRFTIADCAFQTVAFLCAALACANAVVLSGYNGDHGLSSPYSDYGDLDEYVGSTEYKVLPTVAVPVHSVSASPLHLDASHGLHGYNHHHTDEDHDYYVSSDILFSSTFSRA